MKERFYEVEFDNTFVIDLSEISHIVYFEEMGNQMGQAIMKNGFIITLTEELTKKLELAWRLYHVK